MKRLIFTAGGLLLLAAMISVVVELMGGYPAKEHPSYMRATVYALITTPLFLAGIGVFVTIPVFMFKRDRLLETTGKFRTLPAAGVLFMPILILVIQILLPLKAYDVISDRSGDLIFHGISVIFFAVIGNYLVTAPPGSRLGFRNRWTLSDPGIWTKTHRFLGANLIMAALIIGPMSAFLHRELATYIFLGAVFVIKAITFLYARSLGKRLAQQNYESGFS